MKELRFMLDGAECVMAFLTEQLESRFKFTKQLIPKMDHH
jgi:hypothetical protein